MSLAASTACRGSSSRTPANRVLPPTALRRVVLCLLRASPKRSSPAAFPILSARRGLSTMRPRSPSRGASTADCSDRRVRPNPHMRRWPPRARRSRPGTVAADFRLGVPTSITAIRISGLLLPARLRRPDRQRNRAENADASAGAICRTSERYFIGPGTHGEGGPPLLTELVCSDPCGQS